MNGINYVNDSTVLLQLFAPGKNFAYVIGDFNDWQIDPAYQMRQTLDGTALWIEITGLTPQQEYRFQYVVDQDVVIADPWAEKYLDEFNDANIFFFTYPNLIDYPTGKTNGMVSVLQTAQTPFNWQHSNNFSRPFSQDLVIYEMWLHDFVLRHDYATLIDTLDYLQNLGVNVIELMPVNEFDNNESWGYNPAFYFAPDKYYGPKDDLKAFIDECHRRGIAVVFDIVFNHAFGQNTMARLYMDKNSNKPTNDNPWFNSYIPHPYGYYNDFDHSSLETQYFIDRCLYFWLTEYKIDGYRFDLSKGFSNVYSYPNNLGLWGNYDADRVYWLKRMYNQVRSFDPNCYMILEHFASNDEELELANHGFLLWGNANHQYKEAAMGYQNGSDFKWAVSSKHRGWPYQHLVGYMESHDEERLMYDCKEYGNMMIVNGDTLYNVRDEATALKRMEACAAFLFTVPGPKMIWQFGELGYDYSINFNGRTNSKPIRWNYFQEANSQL
jgi:1,4-alpha-glucan branching enzyme